MISLDNYTITERVHEGPRNVLYRGCRNLDHAPVVLKLPQSEYPSPSDNARLRHEYAITKGLDLAGVVKHLELVKHDNRLVLVMEDVGRPSLYEVMRSEKIDLRMALRIAASVAGILESLHRHHIIHKDINPRNILIDSSTQKLTLIDFDIATRISEETQSHKGLDALEGTIAYISPEQTGRMNRTLDQRTDLYSLGATLYELLTGMLPFPTTDPMELIHSHIARLPVRPDELVRGVPQVVSQIVMKLLAKAAEDRYQNGWGLKSDLEECLARLEQTGEIEPFPLGQQDRTGELRIPQKLYGREVELATLLDAFESASQGASELLLVCGYAGVGKSALVKEIQKDIVRRRGYFIEGKFGKLTRSIPYAPIVHAFRGLLKQILAEPTDRLAVWKEKLQEVAGSYGPLLTGLIPELEMILGPQPAMAQLGATEAQNRFALGFQDFVRVFTTADHPLVVFLDDLQWADPGSLKLLELLLTDPESGHLLVIAAYRDNEVDAAHPLWPMVGEIRKVQRTVTEIALQPLALPDVVRFMAHALGALQADVEPLAKLAFEKTLGNAFFLNQFLRMLDEEELLRYEVESGTFRWDLRRIREADVTDNVVALMVTKLKRLPAATQRVLRLAACIGYLFDLKTLSVIHERSPADTAADLWGALREGLVLPLDSEYRFLESPGEQTGVDSLIPSGFDVSYRFLHDRVQQAAYSLIEEGHRQELHLRIGRLMLGQREHVVHEEYLLAMTNHLNIGASLIQDPEERLRLSRLNLEAGRRAKVSTAYAAAAGYFEAGISLLPPRSWEQEYDLTYSLHVESAECDYLSNRYESAESSFDTLLSHAKSNLERAHVQNLRIVRYTILYKPSDALKTAKAALAMFGIELPDDEDGRKALADAEVLAVEKNLANRRIEDLLEAPSMTDPETLAALKILVDSLEATYMAGPSLLVYVAAKQVNLSLQYGNSNLSSYGYMHWGFILAAAMGRFAEAYEFGKLALALNEKWKNAALTCNLNLLFFCTISFYRRPLRESIPYSEIAYEAGFASGDFIPLSFTCQHKAMIRLGLGDELDSIREETERFIILMKRIKNGNVVAWLVVIKQMIANMQGHTLSRHTLSDATFDEPAFLAEIAGYHFTVPFYYIVKLQVLFLREDYTGALAMAYEAEKRIGILMRMYPTTELPFYFCLTLMALYPTAAAKDQERYLKEFSAQQAKLAFLAEAYPPNFHHKYLLTDAELARVQGNSLKAADLYDSAIDAAHENGFPMHETLANELAAKFYLARSKKKIARVYMTDAYHGYLRWGAVAKAEDIATKYPHLLIRAAPPAVSTSTTAGATTAKRVPAEMLDMKALLRAAQAIASEIVLEKVLDRWMRIVIENAGAQKGALILNRNNQLTIEAAITVDPDTIQVGLALPVELSTDLALAIVQYVARTREALILDDPSLDARFAGDPYVIAHQPKSVLCMAMTHHGRLTGILYLENNIACEAFNPTRLELLGLLGSQAAFAVQNALLYAHVQLETERLEHEVQHRTDELRQANERLQLELVERARSEREHAALREEVIRVQSERLAELSSPLIPISDQIMVMPLIGTMDEQRAQQVLEAALQGVQANQTRVVIIDITGVKRVDAGVASTLMKMAQGLRLLGAQVVLTGIRPSVATTFVELGVDLQSIITRSTLQSAIAYALERSDQTRPAQNTGRKPLARS